MKAGDLVKVNKRTISALWHKVGIVIGRERLGMLGPEVARVLLDGRARLVDYCSLDVIYASR